MVPETGRLPANAVGVAIYSPKSRWPARTAEEIPEKVSVEIKEEGVFRAVPAVAKPVPGFGMVYVVGPRKGLTAGRTYRFTDLNPQSLRANEAPESVVVTVDHARLDAATPFTAETHPLPSNLEHVSASAICSLKRWVTRVRVITLLPEAPPEWLDQLLYVTLVDGDRRWVGQKSICHEIPPGRSRLQTGWSLLYARCPPPPGVDDSYEFALERTLRPTPHTVKVEAFLPGTEVMLATETVVDLSCPGD